MDVTKKKEALEFLRTENRHIKKIFCSKRWIWSRFEVGGGRPRETDIYKQRPYISNGKTFDHLKTFWGSALSAQTLVSRAQTPKWGCDGWQHEYMHYKDKKAKKKKKQTSGSGHWSFWSLIDDAQHIINRFRPSPLDNLGLQKIWCRLVHPSFLFDHQVLHIRTKLRFSFFSINDADDGRSLFGRNKNSSAS